MNRQSLTTCRIQKVVLSSCFGVHEPLLYNKVSEHLIKILKLSQKPKKCFCRNPVAKWKTRKGTTALGLMLTLRKKEALRVLKLIMKDEEIDDLKYDRGSGSLRKGIVNHRGLGLERYDHTVPDYGFNYTICFSYPGKRAWLRRINPCTKKIPRVSEEEAREFLQKSLKENDK